MLDILMQSRRDKGAAKRLLRKLLNWQCRAPRVMITDKLASYGAAKKEITPGVKRRFSELASEPACNQEYTGGLKQ